MLLLLSLLLQQLAAVSRQVLPQLETGRQQQRGGAAHHHTTLILAFYCIITECWLLIHD